MDERRKIEITSDDLQNPNIIKPTDNDRKIIDLSHIGSPQEFEKLVKNFTYPLRNEEVQQYISGAFPQKLQIRLNEAQIPSLPSNPTSEERLELTKVLKRRNLNNIFHENIPQLLLQEFYEETFAVNPAETLGGFLSHFCTRPETEELYHKLKSIDQSIFKKDNQEFADFLFHNFNHKERMNAIENFFKLSQANQFDAEDNMPNIMLINKAAKNINDMKNSLNGYLNKGWLNIKIYDLFDEELSAPLKDSELIEKFNLENKTKIQALFSLWMRFSSTAIDNKGYFIYNNSPDFDRVLEELAFVRSSPDFQFLYKNFSKNTAISEKINQDNNASNN